ncbi:MAG TPA: flagellar protein FlaG [Thermotogota bacterium]|nr:flagellar protein FlaG [Thermotogota bacterium]HRW93020.1 flagellar protein FlaG [Thermotogota bacterium]
MDVRISDAKSQVPVAKPVVNPPLHSENRAATANRQDLSRQPYKEIKEDSLKDLAAEVEGSLDRLKGLVQSELRFEVNKDAEKLVIQIVNRENGEVLKQIPPEEMVRISEHINELLGVLFDKRA